MQVNIHCHLTAQTDLGLISRTFSQKLISFLHFQKSVKDGNAKDCVYMVR